MTVNGAATKPGHKLRGGDEVCVTLRPPEPVETLPQDIPITVLFEDAHLIVIDKQPGMVVHPAPGHPDGTLVNALLHHCDDLSGVGGELRPGIVHRLDKDTSGVMVASKDDATHNALAALFKSRTLTREYIAIVAPPPPQVTGTFDTLYGRHPVHRKKFSSKVPSGKQAVTRYEVAERLGDLAAIVRVRLSTGRTHQIRVHFADAGSPVLGDPLYARRPRNDLLSRLYGQLGRQALHAHRLEFTHPITREDLVFRTEPPADMQAAAAELRDAVVEPGR